MQQASSLNFSLTTIDACWMIEPLRGANALLQPAASAEQQAADKPPAAKTPGYKIAAGGVAVLTMRGVMTKGSYWWLSSVSTTAVRAALAHAAQNSDVRAIMLSIDSPGGQVSGTSDLAAEVKAAANIKPVAAYIEDMGCSAAYWVASQADMVCCNATAQVGSIGTITVLEDTSKMAENEGVKVHVLATGPHKGIGIDGAPVTPEHLQETQRMLHEINSHFIAAVKTARGLSREQLDEITTARVFVGEQAVKAGLIDRVCTVAQAVSSIRQKANAKETISMENEMPQVTPEQQNLLAAMKEAKIADAAEIKTLIAQAAMGRRYEEQLRAEAKREAVRAHGAERGVRIGAQVDRLDPDSVLELRDAWRAEADAKFDTTEASGAQRASAAAANASIIDGGSQSQTREWDLLAPAQREMALKMGFTSQAKQDEFARNMKNQEAK